jgi:hypothetical protein
MNTYLVVLIWLSNLQKKYVVLYIVNSFKLVYTQFLGLRKNNIFADPLL